jgi:tRNA A37 threonylcarbamoyladenosine dehydratase
VAKVKIMAERLMAINPDLILHAHETFLSPDAAKEILETTRFDYVMDCIDSVTPKLTLLKTAYDLSLKTVSSMGAGGKLDPTKLRTTDLLDTRECYLAALVRKRIRRLGVGRGIKAVFSLEKVRDESLILTDGSNFKKSAYGTISYLPAAFGGACASVVIRDILDEEIPMEKRLKAHMNLSRKSKKQ